MTDEVVRKRGRPKKVAPSRKNSETGWSTHRSLPEEFKRGIPDGFAYCRKCQKFRKTSCFGYATDKYLDSNGLMSVCKDCIGEMYGKFFQSEHTPTKTLFRMCRALNIAFNDVAIKSVEKYVESGKVDPSDPKVFGTYRTRLSATDGAFGDTTEKDMTFDDPEGTYIAPDDSKFGEEDAELRMFWGEHLEYDEIVYLEKELSEWKKTHKCDTKAEETLLKEICYKQLEIRKARTENRSTTALVNDLQNLMKTASVDPAKTSMAGSGRAQDTFSAFIKTIEENEPAEYYQDKSLFKDFDNIDWYFKKYILRPLKNFITGSRDFNVAPDDESEEDFDLDEVVKSSTDGIDD